MAAIPSPPHLPFTGPSSPLASSTSPYSRQLRTPTHQRQYKHRDFSSPTSAPDNPRKAFLRERLKQRCFDRAQQARESHVKNRRWSVSNAPSSDGFDCEMDDQDECDDQEDATLNDELFRRIMASAKHKAQHNFRLSYQLSVGSSLDPDMEDVAGWEHELQDHPLSSHSEELPGEFDDEELAAYAEERAVLQDLEDCTDEIFSLSDFEDVDDLDKPFQHKAPDGDVCMCL